MSALAVVPKNSFVALADGGGAVAALAYNVLPGEELTERDLLRVKLPAAGGTKWTIPGPAGDEVADAITGAFVFYAARGVVWPSQDKVTAGQFPFLRTDDLVRADIVGDDHGDINMKEVEACKLPGGGYDWKKLTGPQGPFGFGTGKNGKGKRAKEMRVLGILRHGDMFPVVIMAPPGSLRNVTGFVRRLPGVPYFQTVVELRLEKAQNADGIAYSQIVPKLVGQLDSESAMKLKAMYTDRMGAVVADLGDGDE